MIEKVHNDFLWKITLSKKSTPLYMLLGELGRYPLNITINARMVGFWNRLIHGKNTKLSLFLYQRLRHSQIKSKWLTHIQNIFVTVGRPDIWQFQQNFNMVSLSSYIKSILIDQYLQEWQSKTTQSPESLTYLSIKSEYALEKHFLSLPRKHFLNLFKFRTGNHKLPVEVGRWDGTDINNRKCSLCTQNDIGDEYHYLFKCPHFKTQRQLFMKPYYTRRPNMMKFGEIHKSNITSVLIKNK